MPLSTIFQLYRGGQFNLVDETGVPRENHRLKNKLVIIHKEKIKSLTDVSQKRNSYKKMVSYK
jgi:hypothetical protein